MIHYWELVEAIQSWDHEGEGLLRALRHLHDWIGHERYEQGWQPERLPDGLWPAPVMPRAVD